MKTTTSKQEVSTLKEMGDMFSQRNDPEFLRKQILSKPKKTWQIPVDKGERVLSYNLLSEIEHGPAISAIENSMEGFNFMNFRQSKTAELFIAHSSRATRIESLGKGVFGEGFCYINDEKQGLIYLDKKDKTFLYLPTGSIREFSFREKFKVRVLEVNTLENNRKRISLQFSSPLKVKYVLTTDANKKYQEFSRQAWSTILGCPDCFSRAGFNHSEYWQHGIPVEIEIFSYEPGEPTTRISHVVVKKIKVHENEPGLFSIPKDYKDLREVKKPEKGYTVGKPFRFSSMRNNYKTKQHNNAMAKNIGVSRQPLTEKDDLNFPNCFPSTYGSLISNTVDQTLLNDIRFIFNGITKRLSGFNGSNGILDIDWLNQFQNHALSLSGGAGSGLFHLLRDNVNGQGLLDKLSLAEVRKMLVAGDVSDLTLPAALTAKIAAIAANTSILPEDRFNNLTSLEQRDLREAFLSQKLATIHLNYPSSTPTRSIFHNLLNVRLDNIDFDIRINNQELMPLLQFDGDHTHLHLSLPDARGTAWMTRWPSTTYWAVLAGTSLACFIFPPSCPLLAFTIAVGLFLALDFAFVLINLSNIEIDARITFTPDVATNVLRPSTDLELDADVFVFYGSVIPTGVHQIVSIIIDIVANMTDIVINQIESQAEIILNRFLRTTLSLSYPPNFGPVPLTALFNTQEYNSDNYFYIETSLSTLGSDVSCPYITQVDSEIQDKSIAIRDDFKSRFRDPVAVYNTAPINQSLLRFVAMDFTDVARYYMGTVISQNFLNHYIHSLWRALQFNYEFPRKEADALLGIILKFAPEFDFCSGQATISLWPAVSPRTLLTPKPASEGDYYATTFFDDVRLCIKFPCYEEKKKLQGVEFQFAAQVFTEIGFGSVDHGKGKLDILKITDRFLDIFFDTQAIRIRIIHPEIQSFTTNQMSIGSTTDYSALSSLQILFQAAMKFALASRDSKVIPRGSADTKMIQRYELGSPAYMLVMELTPYRGNIYISKGISAPGTAMLEGVLNIDTIDEVTATIIRSFIPVP